jgi:hypothetical protein
MWGLIWRRIWIWICGVCDDVCLVGAEEMIQSLEGSVWVGDWGNGLVASVGRLVRVVEAAGMVIVTVVVVVEEEEEVEDGQKSVLMVAFL